MKTLTNKILSLWTIVSLVLLYISAPRSQEIWATLLSWEQSTIHIDPKNFPDVTSVKELEKNIPLFDRFELTHEDWTKDTIQVASSDSWMWWFSITF